MSDTKLNATGRKFSFLSFLQTIHIHKITILLTTRHVTVTVLPGFQVPQNQEIKQNKKSTKHPTFH